jgi:hypothetical protein
MGMVAPRRRIGSAFFVSFGRYGEVSRFAKDQGISRQLVYRDARQVTLALEGARGERELLRAENAALRRQVAEQQQKLDQAVVLNDEKQAEFATVGQACGVTLSQSHTLLRVLKPRRVLSVPTLGRHSRAAGKKAGALLEVLDTHARQRVRDAAADEIYVRDPVLMVVEQASLCWIAGRLTSEVSGPAWAQEFGRLSNLEQVARDGGSGLAKGVERANAERQAQKRALIVDQGDHFHALRNGGVGLRKAQARAAKALAQAEAAEKALEECARQGESRTAATTRARTAWRRAEEAMDEWQNTERLWQRAQAALLLITPQGELNTRARAEAVLAETLSPLPDQDFAKAKRQLKQPPMLNFLDEVHRKLDALQRTAEVAAPEAEISAEIIQAAVRQEALRRRPELLQGEKPSAAALRGILLVSAVVLNHAGAGGERAVAEVRSIFRRAYRASSLVECINSVLRMQQAQHRKMTQELLDLKRLYWNSHAFRSGHRRKTTPYERLGVPWPEGMEWWDVLKLTPEQLQIQLSNAKTAA